MINSSLNPIEKIKTTDSDLSAVQDNIVRSLSSLLVKEILDGQILKNISLASGSINKVSHLLSRPVTGYIVIKKNANATIWDSESSNAQKDLFLTLNTSANCTVSLWVF